MARTVYATNTDLIKMYPGIQTGGNETPADWEAYIQKAEFKVKTIIGMRYDVGFSAVPPTLKWITIDLAAVYIYRTHFQGTTILPNQSNEAVEEKIMAQLKDIAAGEELLHDENDNLISQKANLGSIDSTTDAFNPPMNVHNELYQEYDEDRLDDIEDALT